MNRQPQGTPIGGQFSEGRKPEGGDLTQITPRQAELNRQAAFYAKAVAERGLFRNLIVTLDDADEMGKFSIKAIGKNGITLTHTQTGMTVRTTADKVSAWHDPSWIPPQSESDYTSDGLDATGVDSRDPRVQAGEVFDTVLVADEYTINGEHHTSTTKFYRRREGVFGGSPYAMRIQANRPLDDDEMRVMAGLLGYAYRSTVAGESIGQPMRDSPYSFVVSSDMTKSSRDDLGMAMEDFEEVLPAMFEHGSPIRKTDRAGAGTKGTRLVQGLGADIKFELYYDDVVD